MSNRGVFQLPPGWTTEKKERKSGKYAGQIDTYYIAPDGKRCRSTVEVMQYEEEGRLNPRSSASSKRRGKKGAGRGAGSKKKVKVQRKPGPCPDGLAIEVGAQMRISCVGCNIQ